jgi:transposase
MDYFIIKKSIFIVPSDNCYEEFKKIDKFIEILNKSGIGKIIETEQNRVGRKGYNPYNLVATIIYCFSKFKSTIREIENLCIFDFRVIYIMEQEQPSDSSIKDCINKYILPHQYEIFTMITKTIIDEFHLDISNQYLNGTKIEANANKYKFVWKPTTFHKKLDLKIKELLLEMELEFDDKNLIKSSKLNELIKEYIVRENIDIFAIPTGKGKRLTKTQKNYKLVYGYLIKLLEYEEKEEICGENRNSYYKTDNDATAMVLKEDYYSKLSNDFHAGYNIQVLVSSGLITIYGVFQDRSDHYTFIPMNDLYHKYYKKYPENECADAGYGIYINYKYIKNHNIGNYVKFQSWEGEASGKGPQLFYTFDDGIMCLNTNIAEEIKFEGTHQRNKDGKLYKFIGCNSCNYSYKCKAKMKEENKNKDYRIVELIKDYELLKEQARNNLLSPSGIEIRINRSIQVEGTFGQLKQNMQYIRIRRRGIEKVSCEIMLMCLGRNIRKFFTLLDSNKIKSNYWEKPSNLKPEKFPFPKQKRAK